MPKIIFRITHMIKTILITELIDLSMKEKLNRNIFFDLFLKILFIKIKYLFPLNVIKFFKYQLITKKILNVPNQTIIKNDNL
jgi:hypothetical protein